MTTYKKKTTTENDQPSLPGMPNLDTLSNLSRKPRKSKLKATTTPNSKLRLTLWLDADVVRHFKQQAAQPGSAKYQTLINAVLRQASFETANPLTLLLQDKQFIAALAQQVAALTNPPNDQ